MAKGSAHTLKLDFKEFPPGVKHIKIPMASGKAAAAALALYSPCRPGAVWGRHAAYILLRQLGPRAFPGRAVRWTPPMGTEIWDALCTRWRDEFGAFDSVAIAERAQVDRSGFVALLLDGSRPRAFAKVRRGEAAALSHEYAVMRQVWLSSPRCFSIPEPLGVGRSHDWQYVAVAPLSSAEHRVPRNPPLKEIAADIGEALQGMAQDAGCPDHWLPMHGDCTPWNLRELPDGRLVLFDWEDAAWAPPEADEVLYRASNAALGNAHAGEQPSSEAVGFWFERISARSEAGDRERDLHRSLLRALRLMDGRPENRHRNDLP